MIFFFENILSETYIIFPLSTIGEKTKMKKLIIISSLTFASLCFSAPHPQPRHNPQPQKHHHNNPPHHHHNYNRRFFTGLTVGLVGGIIANQAPQPPPPPRLIWIEGHFEGRVQQNGLIVQVWIPGHYIQQ